MTKKGGENQGLWDKADMCASVVTYFMILPWPDDKNLYIFHHILDEQALLSY